MNEEKSRGKLNLEYLCPQTALGYDFYMSPKLLYDHEAFDGLDYGAKHLYCRMLSRAGLSAKNADEFTDELGRLYIIYTIEQVMKDMRCSEPTAVKMLKQLDNFGLIEKKRRGQGKPSFIYVKDFASVQFLNLKNLSSETKKDEVQNLKNFKGSYNNLSYNNLTYINPINQSAEPHQNTAKDKKRLMDTIGESEYSEYEELIKENIHYDMLVDEVFEHPETGERHKPYNKGVLDEMVFVILDTVCSKKDVIRVGGEEKPAAIVKNQLLKLDSQHIGYVYSCLQGNTSKVYNIRSYLLTALYNAPSSMNSYYRQEVNHDLFGRGRR